MRRFSLILFLALLTAFILFPETGHAGFGFKVGANAGIGKMGNESNGVQSRTMNSVAFYGMPGYSFMGFLFGPLVEYSMVGQTTSESDVGNTNLRGNGYSGGLAAAFDFLLWHVIGSYDLMGQHKLSNTTSAGQESIYTGRTGYRLMAGFRFMPFFSADVFYSDHKFSKNSLGGTETDISSDKLKDTRYGVGISFHW